MKSNGIVFYRGPSMLDGSPIVGIAVGLADGSTNRKTGAMVQTYILRADVSPVDAVKSGADASICGACPHRGDGTGKGRTCYVNVGQGPGAVYRTLRAGKYPDGMPNLAGRVVRLGTYGDPAAIPADVWHALLTGVTARTGYTHQWRVARFAYLRAYCMASVDNEPEAIQARADGWRTFRVVLPGHMARMPSESVCPASAEAGKLLTCAQCLACGGGDRRGSIAIAAHGGFAVMANVRKAVA
jgi:hypothetical protein